MSTMKMAEGACEALDPGFYAPQRGCRGESGIGRPVGKEDLCEIACERRARENLVRSGTSCGADPCGVHVRYESERTHCRQLWIALHCRDRFDRRQLVAVQVEDDHRRFQAARLLQYLFSRFREDHVYAGRFGGGADLRAEQEVVDGNQDHMAMIVR